MIRVRQIKLNVNNDSIFSLKKKISHILNININSIIDLKIHKKSLDARRKPELFYSYEVDLKLEDENIKFSQDVFKIDKEEYRFLKSGNIKINKRPVIVGSGPAGLFCAYILSQNGYKPIIIERGEKIEDRVKTVDDFWENGTLNENSNVQFGEGGAGTFSDGKLNTLVKDPLFRQKKVFEVFVSCGADESILYDNKPHIGTDVLRNVVINLRNKIIEYGGEFRYNTCLTDINIDNNKITSIELNNKEILETEVLVLCIGHSSRDTFYMLNDKLDMSPKSFAVGIRIEHPQDMIDYSQYGSNDLNLPAASYKLTYKAKNGRGVYTFCMCPGGFVVNASSEKGRVAINGMSNHDRSEENANSAIIVTINPSDFGESPMDGIEFQRRLEEKAYIAGKGKIPVQLYGDFKNNKVTEDFKNVKPIFKGNYSFANLNEVLPDYICESLKEGIDYFNNKIKGYSRYDSIIAGVESRTSSPIKILRDENCESNIKGIFPCGEGAGYAGGITSSAMDGLKVAEAVASIYKEI